jgi:hypothetical protein
MISEIESGSQEFISNNYDNLKIFQWDDTEAVKFYYCQEEGMMIDNGGSLVNVRNDGSIIIKHRSGNSTIELGEQSVDIVTTDIITSSSSNQILENSNYIHVNGKSVDIGGRPAYSAVLFEPMIALFKQMAAVIDQKLPLTPGTTSTIVQSMQNLIKSDSIKLTK